MFSVFDVNHPVGHFLMKVFDCVSLSILWVLFCLPVVTAGAATASAYVTVYRYIRREEGSLFQTFWKNFREDFKRTTKLWLFMLAVASVVAVDVIGMWRMGIATAGFGKVVWVLMILTGFILCCWFAYVIAYAARFQGSIREVLRISFLMMVSHPAASVSIFVLLCAGGVLLVYFPGLSIILPTLICWGFSFLIEKVFYQYLPPEERKKLDQEKEEKKEKNFMHL